MTHPRRVALGLALAALFAPFALASPPTTPAEDSPPDLAGTWTWKWKDANGETHKHTLELEGSGANMVGRERFDDTPAVKVENLKLDGKTLSFAATHDKRRSTYKGEVRSKDTIVGTVTVAIEGQASEYGWTATREAVAEKGKGQ